MKAMIRMNDVELFPFLNCFVSVYYEVNFHFESLDLSTRNVYVGRMIFISILHICQTANSKDIAIQSNHSTKE